MPQFRVSVYASQDITVEAPSADDARMAVINHHVPSLLNRSADDLGIGASATVEAVEIEPSVSRSGPNEWD